MEKEAIALWITDTHLSEATIEQNISVFGQAFSVCETYGISTIFHGGDIFNSRKGQSQSVVNTWKKIIDEAAHRGINIIAIAGNHDKESYISEESFLNAFDGHKAFSVRFDGDFLNYGPINVFFLPYFDEQLTYPKKLQEICALVDKKAKNILLTHIAVNGVTNNGSFKVENEIDSSLFALFDLVLVGHYHNKQIVGVRGNVVYTGSTDPRNFGEDDDKGATLIFNDGTYEFLKFDFKPYINVDIIPEDLDHSLLGKVEEKLYEAHVKLRIAGDVPEEKKALLVQLDRAGAKYEINKDSFSPIEVIAGKQIFMSSTDILEMYKQWAKEKNLNNSEYGEKLLKMQL